jgi:hypothetical protein
LTDSLDKLNMDMRFVLWNVRSLYRAGSLMTVSGELVRYRSDGRMVAPNLREKTHFSMERGMRIMNYVQIFLFISESYKQLRRLRLLVIGCHT